MKKKNVVKFIKKTLSVFEKIKAFSKNSFLKVLRILFFLSLLGAFLAQAQQSQTDSEKEKKVKQRLNRPPVLPSRGKSTKSFQSAQPEDITNENFPDIIDSFDYPNADIQDLIKVISKMTGKNFILDPGVSGKISIITPSQITVAEAYQAFLSALASRGFTVVKSGKFLKIVKSQDASKHAIETYSGEYFPNTDQVITKIIKLKYIDANETINILKGTGTSKSASSIQAYAPTNSLIVTDYGSSIERIVQIIKALDVKGFAEKMVVIKIQHAKAKELATLLTEIIEKQNDPTGRASTSRSRRSYSFRSRRSGGDDKKSSKLSVVLPDERTNSLVVVGNDSGIKEIRELVKKLDFSVSDSGGLYVYYVKYGDAEDIAKTINNIAKDSEKKKTQTGSLPRRPSRFDEDFGRDSQGGDVLGENISIVSEKKTNSLIISANRQDYKTILKLLEKLDIPRDQVFVKMVIMELSSTKSVNWNLSYYRFLEGTNGLGRIGVTTGKLSDFLNITNDLGGTLSFGLGDTVKITPSQGGTPVEVKTITGFINFLKNQGGGNVLSSPNIMALDNEEAVISVGSDLPFSTSSETAGGGISRDIKYKKTKIELKLTPRISPGKNKVKLSLEQDIEEVREDQGNLKNTTIAQSGGVVTDTRKLKTTILVNDKETAVLGGMARDKAQKNESKVPILGDLPLIGWLFKGYSRTNEKRHLVMFITPHIVRTDGDQRTLFKQSLQNRLNFIDKHLGGVDPNKQSFDEMVSSQKFIEERGNKEQDNSERQEEGEFLPLMEEEEPTDEFKALPSNEPGELNKQEPLEEEETPFEGLEDLEDERRLEEELLRLEEEVE